MKERKISKEEKFYFSKHGCGSKDEFLKREERLLKKVSKSIDNKNSEIFTNNEIASIIKHIQLEEERIKQEAIEHEKKMEQMRKNLGI